jgi:hypothetical protein
MLRRYALVLAFVLAPVSAFAYVDPGSGALIWQGLMALIGAVIVFIRQPIQTLKNVINRIRRR